MTRILRSLFMSFLLAAPAAAATPACAAPEYRQFDFWIGDWDVYDVGDPKPSMRIKVEKILDGCALQETYQDVNGMLGESINFYDAGRKLWHQTWATNRGMVLLLDGKLENGRMTFTATEQTRAGPRAVAGRLDSAGRKRCARRPKRRPTAGRPGSRSSTLSSASTSNFYKRPRAWNPLPFELLT